MTRAQKVELIGAFLDTGVFSIEDAIEILREVEPGLSVVGALELFVARTRRELEQMRCEAVAQDEGDDDWTPYREWDGRWKR